MITKTKTDHDIMNESYNGSTLFYGYHDYYDRFEKLEVYILPVVIVMGTLSNGLTLGIFCREKQKRLSVSVHICAYCAGNIAALYFKFGLHFLTVISDFPDLANLNSVGCSLFQFIDKMVSFCAIWFVVGMTIDRYIAICHPSCATTMCTPFMAKVATGIIFIGLIVTSVHAMWIYNLNEDGKCGFPMASSLNDLTTIHLHMWNILSATASVYLPLIILLVLNILLTLGLCFHHGSSSTSRQDNISTEFSKAVAGISFTSFALLVPMTIQNILLVSGIPIPMNTLYTFEYITRVKYFDVILIFLLFSRSFRKEISNAFRQLYIRRKQSVELNRMSNKALLTSETATTTNEEDTLI